MVRRLPSECGGEDLEVPSTVEGPGGSRMSVEAEITRLAFKVSSESLIYTGRDSRLLSTSL